MKRSNVWMVVLTTLLSLSAFSRASAQPQALAAPAPTKDLLNGATPETVVGFVNTFQSIAMITVIGTMTVPEKEALLAKIGSARQVGEAFDPVKLRLVLKALNYDISTEPVSKETLIYEATPKTIADIIQRATPLDFTSAASELTADQSKSLAKMIRRARDAGARFDQVKLNRALIALGEPLAPNEVLVEELRHDKCHSWDAPWDAQRNCADTYDGYAYAQFMLASGYECFQALSRAAAAPPAFQTAVEQWFRAYEKDKAVCTRPPPPARCNIAWCNETYRSGIAFKPSAEIGAAIGLGKNKFGFKSDGSPSFQFNAGIGARYFWWSDAMDVRATIAIAGVTAEDPTTHVTSTTSGIVGGLGIGFFNGLMGLSFILAMDPREGDVGPGFGLSIDAAAINNMSLNTK
jgi:hypothetical protein